MAFFIDLGEEIAADAMGMEGDKKLGSRSIALLKGSDYALRVSVAMWGIVVLLGLLPILMGWLGIDYLIFILETDALLVFSRLRF
jgi:geranylgeranylglycerol-phosphate geranylgeranyltransferase